MTADTKLIIVSQKGGDYVRNKDARPTLDRLKEEFDGRFYMYPSDYDGFMWIEKIS